VTDNGLMATPVTVPVARLAGLISSVAVTWFAEFAVMVARTDAVIEEVDTLNVPADCPCGMMMLAGTEAAALLLPRLTSTPPGPAGAARVTVPVELCPAVTIAGLRFNPDRIAVEGVGGLTVSEADAEFADVAVIEADVGLETDDVETEKVPLVWPCGMVMLAGTDAAPLLLERLTNTPPAAAGPPSVTVPVELCPAVTVAGVRLTPDNAAVPALDGLIVREADV
jgi:hypothetical protein